LTTRASAVSVPARMSMGSMASQMASIRITVKSPAPRRHCRPGAQQANQWQSWMKAGTVSMCCVAIFGARV
ncbi:hypothetical protein, partial [Robbsia andropogonis]|uniref:hypothetical protein n=1 Tax=Robbsia andropogonis TaxID=28092 RepID=UPI001ABA1E53